VSSTQICGFGLSVIFPTQLSVSESRLLLVCDKLTDMSVLELAGLPYLMRLNLVNVHHATDNAIFFIAEHTASMESLHLSHCPNISLDAIHLLTKKLGLLRRLTATEIPALCRPGTERFSENPPPVRPPLIYSEI
jgi:F-box and leucine-rich repeat protein GRR1